MFAFLLSSLLRVITVCFDKLTRVATLQKTAVRQKHFEFS